MSNLFRGFWPDKKAAFTGLEIPQILGEYSLPDIKSMTIFEWTGVMDWRGINIYRGDIVTVTKKNSGVFRGVVEYQPQLCRYIINNKETRRYQDLSYSGQTGSEEGIRMDSIEVTGNSITNSTLNHD